VTIQAVQSQMASILSELAKK